MRQRRAALVSGSGAIGHVQRGVWESRRLPTLRGKIRAALDRERGASKRRKDLLGIERIPEWRPEVRGQVPEEIPGRLGG